MRPRGLEQALAFKESNGLVFPLGSWHAWLAECYRVVEQAYHFKCSWSLLVGVSVGMLDAQPQTRRAFRAVAAREYQRPAERRFRIYFIALVDALTGSSGAELQGTYRGQVGAKLRAAVPMHVLEWPPHEGGAAVLRAMQPHDTALPMNRESTTDFYVYLLYGYYAVTRNPYALEALRTEYTTRPATPSFESILSGDDNVLAAALLRPNRTT